MIHVLSTTVPAVLEGTRRHGGATALVAPEDVIAARARRGSPGDRTLAGRAALRLLLAHVLGERPDRARGISVQRPCESCGGPHGRPRAPGVSLSGSTSEDQVLVAVAAQEVQLGVDVQALPTTLWPGFDAAVRHPRERTRRHDAGLRSAIAVWTRKEAVLKAAGVGLRIDPSSVPLVSRSEAEEAWWSVARDAPGETQGLHVRDLPGAVPRAVAASAIVPVHHIDLDAVLSAL
ncbi:MAG: 4'-phosphopantetheinyl transferase superfamily protein [Brachybacterium sp.]|uniref:4'-phosphopantetheinyl transferase family protein n=1 Tax=Brachybacterium sp. TaxID=1891286 RepID=UPI0026470210|nr:4'-phosphopantetheinyl transferase superfamily protein [Brachybacterium sp.]MDN5685403.1 4'-phosphopantetheinyl transferase superfamily protein [Brachybacterium sp.]